MYKGVNKGLNLSFLVIKSQFRYFMVVIFNERAGGGLYVDVNVLEKCTVNLPCKCICLKPVMLFLLKYESLTRIGVLNMALDQLKDFLKKMESDPVLKEEVLAKCTADDVARVALKLGFEFSGDELLRMSGKKVGRVTVTKTELPGEYH